MPVRAAVEQLFEDARLCGFSELETTRVVLDNLPSNTASHVRSKILKVGKADAPNVRYIAETVSVLWGEGEKFGKGVESCV